MEDVMAAIQAVAGIGEFLTISSPTLDEIPAIIGALGQLKHLRLEDCPALLRLDAVTQLVGLERLEIIGCLSLSVLPNGINSLTELRELRLDNCTSLVGLPRSLGQLTQLRRLSLRGCHKLHELPSSLEHLVSREELDISAAA
jgi:hypothetical protein